MSKNLILGKLTSVPNHSVSAEVASRVEETSVQSLKNRTDHDRTAMRAIQTMKYELQLQESSCNANAFRVSNVYVFETETRKISEGSSLSLRLEQIILAKYYYFAANVNPQSNNIQEFSYEGARERLKPINFDRKRPKIAASASKPSVDKQCEERRTAISRWLSFVDSPFWNSSRPRELARQLAANGLFLLSRYDQFAVKLSERLRNELTETVPADYELLPAPRRLKVRCAFCKRVFEVPYHSSFSFVNGRIGEPSLKSDDEAVDLRFASASHFDAKSHYATVCVIASYVKSQHERKSPSCPAVVGVKSDDERFSELSQSEQNSIALQIQTDPFYELAAANCQAQQASSTDSDDVITRSWKLTAHPVEDEPSLCESPVTQQVEDELFRSYKRLPATAYSDAALLCPDDFVQLGTWREYELNGSARFGDPTMVYDKNCLPVEPDQPVTHTIYDDFSCEYQDQTDSHEEVYNKLEVDNMVSCNTRSIKSSGYFTDSHTDGSQSGENVRLKSKQGYTVSRCDDEAQCGYESIFEQLVSQVPLYAPFRSAELRQETFEAAVQISTKLLSLRSYLAIYVDETNVNAEAVEQEQQEQLSKSSSQLDALRMRIGDSDWPCDRRRLFERLAEAGFFSLRRQESDVCVCFWCGMALSCWHDKADAYVEHARHLRDGEICAYLFYQRGAQFIIDARNHYPVDMARTERVDIIEFSELPDTPADYSLLERMHVSVRKPNGGASLQLKVQKSKAVSSHATEIPYDPVISFRTTGVSYRVEEREVRARKDLRLVRNLIFLCGAQPLSVSFAMERRLKTTMSDFVNARQFLEALWDLEARMRTACVTEIVRFQQLFNQANFELDRNGSVSQTQDIKPGIPASKQDSMYDAQIQSNLQVAAVDVSTDVSSMATSHRSHSTASSGVSSMSSSSADSTHNYSQNNADRQKFCAICEHNVCTIVAMPCNHLVVCDDCMKRKQPNRCPLCRKHIQRSMRIFM